MSCSYKHKSGSQKRKIAAEREGRNAECRQEITNYIKPKEENNKSGLSTPTASADVEEQFTL
jgi:hypothetical protein